MLLPLCLGHTPRLSFQSAWVSLSKALGLVYQKPMTEALRRQIVSLTAKHRLPGMYPDSQYVKAGGLMSYAPDNADLHRRAATYIDRILKGATPGDLPIQEPTKFELVINLRTATA